MTIKIKAPRMWQYPSGKLSEVSLQVNQRRVRIVSEADWRKLMKLVKAVEKFNEHHMIYEALVALEKKK